VSSENVYPSSKRKRYTVFYRRGSGELTRARTGNRRLIDYVRGKDQLQGSKRERGKEDPARRRGASQGKSKDTKECCRKTASGKIPTGAAGEK